LFTPEKKGGGVGLDVKDLFQANLNYWQGHPHNY
jgi:hypothetical protein